MQTHSSLIIPYFLGSPLPESSSEESDEEQYDLEAELQSEKIYFAKEDAQWAHDYYGCAWRQSQYRRVLQEFKGDGTVQRGDGTIPNRGFPSALLDVDPTAKFEACEGYSFRCFMGFGKRNSVKHNCNKREDILMGLSLDTDDSEEE